jgi:hypothetical protein
MAEGFDPGPPLHPEDGGRDLRYGSLGELVRRLERGELEQGFVNVKRISRRSLIDRLNFLDFSEGELGVVFRHPRFDEILVRSLRPEPKSEDSFFGRWIRPEEYRESLNDCRLLGFFIGNRKELVLAGSTVRTISPRGMELTLPEYAYEIRVRSADRYPCPLIPAELIQGGILFPGALEVFSINAFQVKLFPQEGISLKWLNPEYPVQVIFREEGEICYSRECMILKQWEDLHSQTVILKPDIRPLPRFKRREFRASRTSLHPAPVVSGLHPLTQKTIRLTVCDLSTSGLSVEEAAESATLLPGMILSNLRLDLAGAPALSLKAQVVYRIPQETPKIKVGLTILNLSNEDYLRLTNLVNRAMNQHLEVCGRIEPETLWRFFFQVGFIYPQKYQYIRQNKEEVKRLYKRIYQGPSEIERHVTYHENDALIGHISMLHTYDRTWMLHHLAAAPSSRYKRVALTLLQQIERYIIDSHYFESTRMDNIICYFRPENKFPNLVFGGAARFFKDPRICSLERFAYFSYPMILDARQGELPPPWELGPSTREDLEELAFFYQNRSGGQMLKALDLLPEMLGNDRLNETYRRLGFKREHRLFSIKKGGRVQALISLLKTDLGLNLSDLTNGPTLFILDPEGFPFEIFLKALAQLEAHDRRPVIPLLVYPLDYVERQGLRYDRLYDLWIFAVANSDHYFQYINRVFSRLLP